MNYSALARHFHSRRLTRQRLEGLREKKIRVDRFDLITLLFFVYSQEQESLDPHTRLMKYTAEINGILEKCGMMKLNPVYAYDAFVMMCLLTDAPLPTYSEIWEMSYTVETEA